MDFSGLCLLEEWYSVCLNHLLKSVKKNVKLFQQVENEILFPKVIFLHP